MVKLFVMTILIVEMFTDFNSLLIFFLILFLCFRKIIEWNKVLFGATRFRWPETSLQYLPFCITWYAIFILTLVFVGGLFTGVNACFIYL